MLSVSAWAQAEVHYSLAFPNAVHHEAEVTVEFREIKTPTLEVRMSRSSPGRYALHEFAKNVYNVKAVNGQGKPVTINRPNPHQWNLSNHDGTVKITYTLFGFRADGTYNGIDEQHAHLNMPATLMYAIGFENSPATVKFTIASGKNWTVATQLKPVNETTFWAPTMQYLMDSPVELSNFTWQQWQINDKGKTKTIRIALHHTGIEADANRYTEATKQVVAQARAVYGELPEYDYGTYTFIACYMPQSVGDGMEHRNSTVVTSTHPLATHFADHLGTVSHEFFHSWNVERIRPKSLEPFNFAEANMSDALWFAEGFTSYYGDLLVHRSKNSTFDEAITSFGNELNFVLNAPGKNYFSPVEMSMQAPFVDAAQSIDPINRLNTYISYYTYGSVIALALDLELRQKFKNLTLDNYMQALWQTYGKPEKPYTLTDLQNSLATVTRDEAFARNFFQNHIFGKTLTDYKNLLKAAGLELRKSLPGKASLGLVPIAFPDEKATLTNFTFVGSPLYQAGLDKQDVILRLNNQPITSKAGLDAVLTKHQPNDKVTIAFMQQGQVKQSSVTLTENPSWEIVPTENAGGKLTKTQKAFRQNWLGSK
ncbi:M61 family metallopeptidase [Adhaeribacter swui]|uniref:M61 family metallopeptidase n=1 Tax=Adhaeribacter swui TaxID=2086471 RepID=UPI001E335E8E|nr:PDZ domain-containing protein [Adhaeribacter swui]